MGIPLSILYPGYSDYKGQNDRFFHYSKNTIQSISVGKHFFSGRNCEKLIIDNGICVTLVEREDEKFKALDSNFYVSIQVHVPNRPIVDWQESHPNF